jgi:hypothetical protein
VCHLVVSGRPKRTAGVGLVIAAKSMEMELTNVDDIDSSLSPWAMRLEGWSDADWAGDKATRMSHT